jgi:hypothetical protein
MARLRASTKSGAGRSAPVEEQRKIILLRNQKSTSEVSYFARFTCCPPLADVLRESFLTRARVSHARVNLLWAAVNRFSQYIPRVRVIDCFITLA